MKIKAILAVIAIAVAALSFSSCTKIDTGKDAGGYYVAPLATATGEDSNFILMCTTELRNTFGDDIIYKNTANDNRAISACDKVYSEKKGLLSVSFELYFQNAVGEGEKPTKKVIKTYAPAK